MPCSVGEGIAGTLEFGRMRREATGMKDVRVVRLDMSELEGGGMNIVLQGAGMAGHLCWVLIMLVRMATKGNSNRLG